MKTLKLILWESLLNSGDDRRYKSMGLLRGMAFWRMD